MDVFGEERKRKNRRSGDRAALYILGRLDDESGDHVLSASDREAPAYLSMPSQSNLKVMRQMSNMPHSHLTLSISTRFFFAHIYASPWL